MMKRIELLESTLGETEYRIRRLLADIDNLQQELLDEEDAAEEIRQEIKDVEEFTASFSE